MLLLGNHFMYTSCMLFYAINLVVIGLVGPSSIGRVCSWFRFTKGSSALVLYFSWIQSAVGRSSSVFVAVLIVAVHKDAAVAHAQPGRETHSSC